MFFVVVEVEVGGVVTQTTEYGEDSFLLFGRELVVALVVAIEVAVATEQGHHIVSQHVVILVSHISEEGFEAPGSAYDAYLVEEAAGIVGLECAGEYGGTVVALWTDCLSGDVVQAVGMTRTGIDEADGEGWGHVGVAEVEEVVGVHCR